MKTTISLIVCLLALFTGASAQTTKTIDLAVTQILAPTAGTAIYPDSPFTLDAVIKNNGLDSLSQTGKVEYQLLSHTGAAYVVNGQINFYIQNKTIKAGDTAHATMKVKLHYTFPADSTLNFCVKARPLPPTPPPSVIYIDPNPNNDNSCVSLKFKKGTATAVQNAIVKQEIALQGNPVSGAAIFKVSLSEASPFTIELYSINSMKLVSRTVTPLAPGEHLQQINIGDLANGIYVYQARTSGKSLRGKLVVQQ